VLLLAAALSVAAVTSPKLPASARCPQAPYAAPQVTGTPPAGFTCSALELSGLADRTNPALEPAFEVAIAPNRFPATAPATPNALLQGFDTQGHLLFAQPLSADGAFHTYVPVSDATARALSRIRLTVGSAIAEQATASHGEPSMEALSVDDTHVLLAWSGTAFPAIRVREYPNGPLIVSGLGTTSYSEITISTSARVLYVDFSDGVHSYARTIRIWNR